MDAERLNWVCRSLYVPAVCDVLDALGRCAEAMHQRLRPLDPEHCTFAGRARTVRWMETDYVVEDDPYGLEIPLVDSLRPGDVVVHSTDHAGTNAPWGELMSTAARGAARWDASATAISAIAVRSSPWDSPCSTRGSGRWTVWDAAA